MISFGDYAIQNSYHLINTKMKGYTIVFGNSYFGYNCPQDIIILKQLWCKAINMSRWKTWGDVSLYLDGKLIRYINNTNEKVTTKTYYCYKRVKVEYINN